MIYQNSCIGLILLLRSNCYVTLEYRASFLAAVNITWLLFSCINLSMRWFCLLVLDLPVVVCASLLVACTFKQSTIRCKLKLHITYTLFTFTDSECGSEITCLLNKSSEHTLCCEFLTVETAAVVVVLWMQHCSLSPFVAFVSGHPHSSCLLSAACRAFLCFSINWVTIASTVSAVCKMRCGFQRNCDAFLLFAKKM